MSKFKIGDKVRIVDMQYGECKWQGLVIGNTGDIVHIQRTETGSLLWVGVKTHAPDGGYGYSNNCDPDGTGWYFAEHQLEFAS